MQKSWIKIYAEALTSLAGYSLSSPVALSFISG